jgi:hypothetical protein
MDKSKEIELRKFYKEIPEQKLLDMLAEDEKNFEEGAYALLVEEAKRRGLEERFNEIKVKKEEVGIMNKKQLKYKMIRIFSTSNVAEVAVIKSVLDGEKIPYHIKGENFGILYGTADGLSSVDVMVREDHVQKAKELLNDFINPAK